jgi:hypothetical protein
MKGWLCLVFSFFYSSLHATNYYLNASIGNDANKGTTMDAPWKTTASLSMVRLKPGDSVLLASGQRFTGSLVVKDLQGIAGNPVFIGSYSYRNNEKKPLLDAGRGMYAILIQNASFIEVAGLEITAAQTKNIIAPDVKTAPMRCGILYELTGAGSYEGVVFRDLLVHDVYLMSKGHTRSAAETKTANGTQGYGWGIRFINNHRAALLKGVQVLRSEIYNVSHTGLKFTTYTNGIENVRVEDCTIHDTGGPGLQLSGVRNGHIRRNSIDHSGSTADSRNWGRGSGMWTWDCRNMLIEYNRFTNANGPGDSAGVHIDYNCSDVVIQYNLSARNAGGFFEILGNNRNCSYRYNISVDDGSRVKGVNGAFQEGKVFWVSGYVGNKKNTGPFNTYFYNNTIYVSKNHVPRISLSSSTSGILIANNIFHFEQDARLVAGDQKKNEVDLEAIPNVVFSNNVFLRSTTWPMESGLMDIHPIIGDVGFKTKGSLKLVDYLPRNRMLVMDRGRLISPLPKDSIGLRIGLAVEKDILGNPIQGLPDLGAIEFFKR